MLSGRLIIKLLPVGKLGRVHGRKTFLYPNQVSNPWVVMAKKIKAVWWSYILQHCVGEHFPDFAEDAQVLAAREKGRCGQGGWSIRERLSVQGPASICLPCHQSHGHPWVVLTHVRFSCFSCEGNKMAAPSLCYPLAKMNLKILVG